MTEKREFKSRRFFFNDTATTEIYTLSLHDALPISIGAFMKAWQRRLRLVFGVALIACMVFVGCGGGSSGGGTPKRGFTPGVRGGFRKKKHPGEGLPTGSYEKHPT